MPVPVPTTGFARIAGAGKPRAREAGRRPAHRSAAAPGRARRFSGSNLAGIAAILSAEGKGRRMRIRFLGTGDAFGSGGRLNACFLVERSDRSFLIDCGASSMIALRRAGVDPNAVAGILISHLHGDHFGGLPFFVLDGQLVSRRTGPLTVVGPPGLRARCEQLMEACFPGSWSAPRKFALDFVELEPAARAVAPALDLAATGRVVRHPSGAPSLALRVEADGRTLAYSGDTEWVEELVATARDADLFIAEAYTFEKPVRFHMDFATLRRELPRIGAKQVVLTHMSPDMLGRDPQAFGRCIPAFDGMELVI
jgi:ribonuclease BN (tRNA processing enzyme)